MVLVDCNLDKLCAYYSRRPRHHSSVDLSFTTLGWVPYYVESDVICLIAHKRISAACPDYISELIELITAQTAASVVEIHEAPILTYCLEDTIERRRVVSVTTSKCGNHLPLKIRSSTSVNILKSAL